MNLIELHIHPLVKVIKRIFNSCSDILENIAGIYKDQSSVLQIVSYGKEIPMTEHLIDWASNQRQTSSPSFTWINPIELLSSKKNEDIFDELKRTACIIRHESFYEKDKNDLIILYLKFSENALCSAAKDFSAHDKNIFGRLMEATIKILISREYEIHRWTEDVDKSLKSAKFLLKHKKQELYQKLNFAHYILGNLSTEYGVKISLSQEAEQIILSFEGKLQEIKDELTTSVKLAINTLSCPAESIELDDFSLIGLEKKNIEEGKIALPVKSAFPDIHKEKRMGRYSRAAAFLDRLESAVRVTIEKKEKVIGANVAANFSHRKITAAAISDAIKQHNDIIPALISSEPTRWALTCNNFKPVQNLLISDSRNSDK